MFQTRSKRDSADSSELSAALADWEQGDQATEVLSEVSRSRIVARAVDGTRPTALMRTVFFPLRRLALAGAMPLLLLTVMVGYLSHQGMGQAPGLEGVVAPPIFASKTDGEVIFTIANGERAHKVYLSTDPDGFGTVPTMVTRDGAFHDSLSEGPDLVFYRID